jgi:hypothetical protein
VDFGKEIFSLIWQILPMSLKLLIPPDGLDRKSLGFPFTLQFVTRGTEPNLGKERGYLSGSKGEPEGTDLRYVVASKSGTFQDAVAISRLTRCTVPVPTPSALAALRIPAPVAN